MNPAYYGDSLTNAADMMQCDEPEDNHPGGFFCECGYAAKYQEPCFACEGKNSLNEVEA